MSYIKKYTDFDSELTEAVIKIVLLSESYRAKASRNNPGRSRTTKGKKPSGILGRLRADLGLGGGKFLGSLLDTFKTGGSDFVQNMMNKYAPEAWDKISSKTLDKADLEDLIDTFQDLIDKMDDTDKDKFETYLDKIADTLENAAKESGVKADIKI